MIRIVSLAATLILAGLAPLVAQAQGPIVTLVAGDHLAAGNGAKVQGQADGRWRAEDGKTVKFCGADQIALATTMMTSVRTLHDQKTYDNGLVACLDPADFGGKVVADFSKGIVDLYPADTK